MTLRGLYCALFSGRISWCKARFSDTAALRRVKANKNSLDSVHTKFRFGQAPPLENPSAVCYNKLLYRADRLP